MEMLFHVIHPDHSVLMKNTVKLKQRKKETFDALIERRWGTSTTAPKVSKTEDEDPWEAYHDDEEDPQLIPEIEDVVDATGQLLCQQPVYDKIINSEVLLQ